MHGQGLKDPVWRQEDDRIVAGTFADGALIIKTRQPDGTHHIDVVPAKQEAA